MCPVQHVSGPRWLHPQMWPPQHEASICHETVYPEGRSGQARLTWLCACRSVAVGPSRLPPGSQNPDLCWGAQSTFPWGPEPEDPQSTPPPEDSQSSQATALAEPAS